MLTLRPSPRPLLCNLFFKLANPGLFLFIFVLLKLKLCRETVGFSGIRTRTVRVESKYAAHHNFCKTKFLKSSFNLSNFQNILSQKFTACCVRSSVAKQIYCTKRCCQMSASMYLPPFKNNTRTKQ